MDHDLEGSTLAEPSPGVEDASETAHVADQKVSAVHRNDKYFLIFAFHMFAFKYFNVCVCGIVFF